MDGTELTATATTKETPKCRALEKTNDALYTLVVEGLSPGKMFPLLALADTHGDSKKSRRSKLVELLQHCRNIGGKAIVVGDVLDLMQHKNDKRHSKGDIKKDLTKGGSYFNAIIEEESNFWAQWADVVVLFTKGNHETKIENVLEIDVLSLMADAIFAKTGVRILVGGYAGYLRLMFYPGDKEDGKTRNYIIKYYHSSGGYGKSTKGVSADQFMAIHFPDADCVLTGDNHQEVSHPYAQERILRNGDVVRRKQQHIHLPAIKDDYNNGTGGWWIEKHLGPRTAGGAWLEFTIGGRNHDLRMIHWIDSEA